jgi:hypothetical protein
MSRIVIAILRLRHFEAPWRDRGVHNGPGTGLSKKEVKK